MVWWCDTVNVSFVKIPVIMPYFFFVFARVFLKSHPSLGSWRQNCWDWKLEKRPFCKVSNLNLGIEATTSVRNFGFSGDLFVHVWWSPIRAFFHISLAYSCKGCYGIVKRPGTPWCWIYVAGVTLTVKPPSRSLLKQTYKNKWLIFCALYVWWMFQCICEREACNRLMYSSVPNTEVGYILQ